VASRVSNVGRDQHVFFVKDTKDWLWPLAHAIERDRHYVIVIRGTIFPGGWLNNFNYAYADRNETQSMGLPGR
jgi:hypothetical protein